MLCGLLTAVNIAVSALPNGVYTTVTKLEGKAVVGQEATFKIGYTWLTDGDRTGKITYSVADTNCHGDISIDKHAGLVPVAGETEVKCTFDKSAVFNSTTQLQLYDGDVEKETSDVETGEVTVTGQ